MPRKSHGGFDPVMRQSLSDGLAHKIKDMIDGQYASGDRLPTISDMAERFGVGSPTLREALKMLETVGVIRVKHGSGVYVGENSNNLFLPNPVVASIPTKKTLLDLIEARIPIEVYSAKQAAEHITDEHVARMELLLARAEKHLDDDAILNPTNMAFHQEIAVASGNTVAAQLLQVLSRLFTNEQQIILNIYGSRERDYAEHRSILQALTAQDFNLAEKRMREHLEGVREMILQWEPEDEATDHVHVSAR